MGKEPQEHQRFSGRISRKLSIAFGLVFLLVLLVGGISLLLARSIWETTKEINSDSYHIEAMGAIHASVQRLIFEVNQAMIMGMTKRHPNIQNLSKELGQQMSSYIDIHKGEEPFPEREREMELAYEIQGMISTLTSIGARIPEIVALKDQVYRDDLKYINDIATKIPEKVQQMNEIHQIKIRRLIKANSDRMRLILLIYLGFVIVGGLLIGMGSLLFSRNIATPIRRLASVTGDIARGDFKKRVPITSRDEIGQLSHSFNVMAERLEEYKGEQERLAVVEERERISREMHDGLAQAIGYLYLKIRSLEEMLDSYPAPKVKKEIEEIKNTISGAYEEVRQSIFGLRTMVSKSLGLIPTLTEYLHEYSQQTGIAVDLQVADEDATKLSPKAEIQLVRIVQEALTNVRKYSRASQAWVRFELEGNRARITIQDNGMGFDLEEVQNNRTSFGLQTMKERAVSVGGILEIRSTPGLGTEVVVNIPLLR